MTPMRRRRAFRGGGRGCGSPARRLAPRVPQRFHTHDMNIVFKLAAGIFPLLAAGQTAGTVPAKPLRLCIAGLVHGHVDGFLRAATKRQDVAIAGIFDPDAALARQYARRYNLAEAIFFTDLGAMLDRIKPEAV